MLNAWNMYPTSRMNTVFLGLNHERCLLCFVTRGLSKRLAFITSGHLIFRILRWRIVANKNVWHGECLQNAPFRLFLSYTVFIFSTSFPYSLLICCLLAGFLFLLDYYRIVFIFPLFCLWRQNKTFGEGWGAWKSSLSNISCPPSLFLS